MGARLWERGLIGAAEGNLSARLDQDRILCTPSGVSKGHMRPEDLVAIDAAGQPLEGGRPSSEIKLHLRLLALRSDCWAVVHAHPPVATAYAVSGQTIPSESMPEGAYVLGPIALVPFGMPGTDEVPDGIEPFADDHKTFLLSHHGAATLGTDLRDATDRMETLERIARVLLLARLLGGTSPLPPDAQEAVMGLMNGSLE